LSSIESFANSQNREHSYQYEIFIDAGSSGSRLHLFKYKAGVMPDIQDIFSAKTKPGISSYVNHPEMAAQSIDSLLDRAARVFKEHHLNPDAVTTNIIATAGMRLLTEQQQQKIFAAIKATLQKQHFKIGRIETISGEEEGYFGWLDLNYLSQTFQNKAKTIGSLDLGGASTQIAFVLNSNEQGKANYVITLNNIKYPVFSKTFLGLGKNQARKSINKASLAAKCYPAGYKMNGVTSSGYDYQACSRVYGNLLKSFHVQVALPSYADAKFVGYSYFYDELHIFGLGAHPDKSTLSAKIQSVCAQSFAGLLEKFPNENEDNLANYCANATYIEQLLFGKYGYHLASSQLTTASVIKNQDIDIPLGALLHKITSKK
jgi:apyrase